MILENESQCFEEVKKKFPNAKRVPVAMWNISHTYFEDDKYEKIVAESYYTTKNTMGNWDPLLGERNLEFFDDDYNTKFVKYTK